MSAREQMGPNRMAVLLDSDKIGLDKDNKLVKMLVHGNEAILSEGKSQNLGCPGPKKGGP
jgi:hypothetical protein